ncbi:MAG: hypothetical protein HC905_10020 [Bacteroidales bacterium]|nr:hypothetical protein [Bacteroidales bacterium]
MRIGQDSLGNGKPVPRRPLYIPGVSPFDTRVYITDMQPYRPEWKGGGDRWDQADFFAKYSIPGNPENNQAFGGHSDAYDWDRHLGHVPIIYNMLLPYIVTHGVLMMIQPE